MMSYRRCVEPCDRFISGGDTYDRFLGLQHAQASLNSLSDCQHCDSLQLKVLSSRLAALSKKAGLASNPCLTVSVVAEAPHETVTWGDACEPELMESKTTEFSTFLSLSPGHVQTF